MRSNELEVTRARPKDITALVELESLLFHEDAGRHDPYSDTTWPKREGRRDLEQLIESPDALVLAAKTLDEVVGLLVGYAVPSSPTRQPVDYAVLRTMYVAVHARRLGTATLLTERFLDWARERGCVEAHVDHYAANRPAEDFYERLGFAPRSISRFIALDTPLVAPDSGSVDSHPFDLSMLSRRIDQARTERKVSMAALSREVGVSSSTIRRFATATDAEADGVLALVGWLGESPEHFITGSMVDGAPLPPAGAGQIRVDMDLVVEGRSSRRSPTRTTIQRLAVAAQTSRRTVASLTRWSRH